MSCNCCPQNKIIPDCNALHTFPCALISSSIASNSLLNDPDYVVNDGINPPYVTDGFYKNYLFNTNWSANLNFGGYLDGSFNLVFDLLTSQLFTPSTQSFGINNVSSSFGCYGILMTSNLFDYYNDGVDCNGIPFVNPTNIQDVVIGLLDGDDLSTYPKCVYFQMTGSTAYFGITLYGGYEDGQQGFSRLCEGQCRAVYLDVVGGYSYYDNVNPAMASVVFNKMDMSFSVSYGAYLMHSFVPDTLVLKKRTLAQRSMARPTFLTPPSSTTYDQFSQVFDTIPESITITRS